MNYDDNGKVRRTSANLGSTRILDTTMADSGSTANTNPHPPILETDNPPGELPHDLRPDSKTTPHVDPKVWPVLSPT